MRHAPILSLSVLVLIPMLATAENPPPPAKLTEQRVGCIDHQPLRRPLFGETHAHTAYSFDAVSLSTKNPPSDAYNYAKGQPIKITNPQGEQTRCAQLARPLDWAALTDHSEFFGELTMCGTSTAPGYDSETCQKFRANPGAESEVWGMGLTASTPQPPSICAPGNETCHQQSLTLWTSIQEAAEMAYDRTSACRFTSFIGYEWTSMPGYNNRHRNVIFRNEKVPVRPLSVFDTTNDEQQLWARLQTECLDAGHGCDVLTIPHNGNLSDGNLYTLPPGADKAYAVKRSTWEPLSEIQQGKGNSECRTGVGTTDPECGFEQLRYHNLDFVSFTRATDDTKPFAPNAFLRNVLKEGLAKEGTLGANPFQLGFAGGTDTHSALPGGTDEGNFQGLHGYQTADPQGLLSQVEFNPGALTVVWAEQNTRDAIFEAMRRRETYATSGTRPTVRLFAGWNLPVDLCNSSNFAGVGYDQGVPMGSSLRDRPADVTHGPRIAVMAMKDPGSQAPPSPPPGNCAVYKPGADLQRIEIIKGWVDAQGMHERVFTVAQSSSSNLAATVNTATCAPQSTNSATLCSVWTDPEFNSAVSAFYYARVLENPTCRWSTYTCKESGLDPFDVPACQQHLETYSNQRPSEGVPSPREIFSICCTMVPGPVVQPTEIPRIEQQRAWTSPVWYTPVVAAKKSSAKKR